MRKSVGVLLIVAAAAVGGCAATALSPTGRTGTTGNTGGSNTGGGHNGNTGGGNTGGGNTGGGNTGTCNAGPCNTGNTGTGTTGATATTSTTTTTPAAPFGLGLTNAKVELSFKDRVFTSCPAADRLQVPPSFSGGWVLVTYRGAGAANAPVNVHLFPAANSPFGNTEFGSISPDGVLTVTGNGAYEYLGLTLTLPAKVSTGHFTGQVDVSGTAVVHLHAAQRQPDCDQDWTASGTLSPP